MTTETRTAADARAELQQAMAKLTNAMAAGRRVPRGLRAQIESLTWELDRLTTCDAINERRAAAGQSLFPNAFAR